MKIRIKGNSLRLRLTQSEVAQFLANGMHIEQTQVNYDTFFSYSLRMDKNREDYEVSMEDNNLNVTVPFTIGQDWASGEEVGFQATIPNGDEDGLFILVEKDFTCLTARPEEDESDNYPNPLAKGMGK